MTVWASICFIISYLIFELQILIIWLYLSRKSDMQTTIVDLVNKDTLHFHNINFSLIYIILALTSNLGNGPVDIPNIIALILAILFFFAAMICYLYYSIGISIRFYLIMKQKICLSENYTDGEIQIFIRCIIISISGVVSVARTYWNHYTGLYYELTHTRGVDPTGLPIVISILIAAIIINVVCRSLIYKEKIKMGHIQASSSQHFKSTSALSGLVFLALWACLLGIRPQIFGEYVLAVRFIWLGTSLNVVPFMYIIFTKDCFDYIKQILGIHKISSDVNPQ